MVFKKEDLRLCDYQYQIKYTSTKSFKKGQVVFLKSNPGVEMVVHDINDKFVETIWYSSDGELQVVNTSPECLLQYKYAGLLIANKKFNVCLS